MLNFSFSRLLSKLTCMIACAALSRAAFSSSTLNKRRAALHLFTNSFLSRSYLSTSSMSESCSASSVLEIAQFLCLSDNYGYLIHDKSTGQTAAIDTPDARPYQDELKRRGWKLTHILNTHHHWDHTGGNMDLKKGNVSVIGPASEKAKIPGIDVSVKDGDEVEFGQLRAKVIDVGGHTKGHIAYYFPSEKMVFVGDSLFALGCGRMFEGTPSQFWASLLRLRGLPDDTAVYCGHEYTESNAKFAVSVEPGNSDLMARYNDVKAMRAKGKPTVPTSIGLEKKTNPFFRSDFSDEIRKNVGVTEGETDTDAFAKVRKAKDQFRG